MNIAHQSKLADCGYRVVRSDQSVIRFEKVVKTNVQTLGLQRFYA